MEELKGKRIGFAMCGSFCTFSRCFDALGELLGLGCEIIPIMSFNAYETDTRFGNAAEHRERLEEMCGREIIHTIAQAEPIGPKNMTDIMLVANCTGNTLAKLAASITDTPVTMAVKSHLRANRPVLLNIVHSRKVLIEGCTFKNSPAWCLHPRGCNHITLHNVTVNNPWYSQNGDALDLESCTNAIVAGCHFDAGDDAICIKSGKDEDGRRHAEPARGIIITDNVVYHGHGGFVVGSEMSGGVQNIWVSNCTFMGTDVGLRFKSCRGRGGLVENIYISNINMINIISEAIIFNLFYTGKARGEEVTYDDEGNATPVELPAVDETTPVFRNIFVKDVICKGAGRAVFFNGLPEKRIENIHMDRFTVTEAKEGAVFCEAQDITLNNLHIETLKPGPACRMSGVANVSVDGTTYDKIGAEREIPLK